MRKASQSATREYERIDAIRSITAMREALKLLDPVTRKEVILVALSRSHCQFTWSFFAGKFEVPKAEWPPIPKVLVTA